MDFNSYTDRDYIPNNYFCKFSAPLTEDINWHLKIFRYVSILFMEQIEVVLHSDTLKTYYDDELLREKSYMFANNGRNYTSHMTLDIKNSATMIDIYARNTLKYRGKTFRI